MNYLFEKIATTALTGLAVFGFASSAFAAPVIREGTHDAHVQLVRVIEANGVDVQVNHAKCQEEEGLNGFYSGRHRVLVVCNDQYVPDVNEAPAWTQNDYDTLRHEAHHFLQDCVVGSNHDHHLNVFTRDPEGFALRVLGPRVVDAITRNYRQRTASNHILRLEYEAFATARLNIPLKQAEAIGTVCGAN